jgi:DNA-binding CsgD family transcriptional regulator
LDDASCPAPWIVRQAFIEPNRKNLSLSPLEKQIIALVLAGYTSKESGQRIGVSQSTVRHHLRGIIGKLGVANRLELALFALHHHLIGPLEICHSRSPVPVPPQLGCHRIRRSLGAPTGYNKAARHDKRGAMKPQQWRQRL